MSGSLEENSRVVLVGAGNLATCLGEALGRVGVVSWLCGAAVRLLLFGLRRIWVVLIQRV